MKDIALVIEIGDGQVAFKGPKGGRLLGDVVDVEDPLSEYAAENEHGGDSGVEDEAVATPLVLQKCFAAFFPIFQHF